MPYIEMNLDDVTEPKPAGKGRYALQITGAEATESGEKSKHPGTPMIRVTLGFTDPELATTPTFNHFLVFPYAGQENQYYTKLNIKRFLTQVGLDWGGGDLEALAMDLVARTGTFEVGLTEPREDGTVFNTLILDRLPEQNVSTQASRSSRKR